MDGRVYVPWFSVGETDEDALETLEGAQHTFVSVLRERAVTCPAIPTTPSSSAPRRPGSRICWLCSIR